MNVYLNRDMSWLKFNQRVLDESKRNLHPLLERALFLRIVSSNLKEFAMIRVGSLKSLLDLNPDQIEWRSGLPLSAVLHQLNETINTQRIEMLESGKALLKDLQQQHISLVAFDKLSESEQTALFEAFENEYFMLSHRMKVSLSEFILTVKSNQLYRLIKTEKNDFYQIEFINEPPYAMAVDKTRYVRVDDILNHIFQRKNETYMTVNFTRNADIDYNADFDDTDEVPKAIRKLLKKRQTQDLLRLHLKCVNLDEILPFFKRRMALSGEAIYAVDDFESWENLHKFLDGLIPHDSSMRYPAHQPAWPVMMDEKKSIIKQLLKHDALWHYPYDSFVTFEMLIYEGAMNQDVEAMYITIYRLAESSHLVNVLKMARKNGKKVTVILELRARFDEKNNLYYAQELEASGCKVLYGPKTYKLHAKLFLMTFKDGRTITQIGSGNYHEITARRYTDFAYLTAHEGIGKDAKAFFDSLKTKSKVPTFNHLLVAPHQLKHILIEKIQAETQKKDKGFIAFKINALTDKEMMDALVEAAQAGVKIKAIIRSIVCLKPELKGITDSFKVQSTVGRFLEHSRVYFFGQKHAEVYVGSSDLMSRNLTRRHEVLAPVYDETVQKRLRFIFDLSWDDNVSTARLNQEGDHIMKVPGKTPISVQEFFYKKAKKNEDYL